MSKRLIAILAAAVFAPLALAGCGGDDGNTPAATTTPKPEASAATAGASASAPTQGDLAAKVRAIAIPELASGRKIGKDDARVKLQIYEDFRCPHCLEFTANFEQHLIETYVKPGIAQLEFKYFPLSQTSLPIMAAAACAEQQGQFWAYDKRLFLAHAESGDAAALTEAFSDAKLKAYAAELKLDTAKFETCLAADSSLGPVAADYREARALGVNGTPAFVINGKLLPNVPGNNATWKSLIEAAAK